MQALWPQLAVAAGAIALTAVIHAVFTVIIRGFARMPDRARGLFDEIGGVFKLTIVSLWLVAAHALSCVVWAMAYMHTGVTSGIEDALYFALTTYTTLGFGDVLAPKDWQLLTGFASVNGLLMFGLSAAVMVDAAAHVRTPRR